MPGTSSQEASAGLTRAPPAGGEHTEVEALPSHHRVKLVPTGQREGSLWEEAGWRVLSKCWGGAGGEEARGRCGGGCENLKKKVQALRWKQKVLCKEVPEPQSQSPPGKAENAEGEECAR